MSNTMGAMEHRRMQAEVSLMATTNRVIKAVSDSDRHAIICNARQRLASMSDKPPDFVLFCSV